MSRRVSINLMVFVGVFLVMVWWAVNNIVNFDFIQRPYQVSADFAATVGVSSGSEVTYLGVHFGDVRSVEPMPGGVTITMDIDRGREIPAGSRARIFRKSAIGEPYVDFEVPAAYTDGMPAYAPGAHIDMANTTVPLEFSELLRAASRVIGSVDPDQTRILVHELALALKGRSDDLRGLTASSDALLATFAARTELLDRLSANNTELTRTIVEHRGSLSAAVSDLADLAESLAAVEPDTQILLDRGVDLLALTADLVSDVKQNVDCVLHDLDDISQLTTRSDQLSNLEYVLQTAPEGLGYVFAATDIEDDGAWVRVHLITAAGGPPPQYSPPTELPAVPTVPPCVSTLSSRGTSATVGSFTGGSLISTGASLPATGGRPAGVAAVVVVAGAFAALRARRLADNAS